MCKCKEPTAQIRRELDLHADIPLDETPSTSRGFGHLKEKEPRMMPACALTSARVKGRPKTAGGSFHINTLDPADHLRNFDTASSQMVVTCDIM